MICQKKNKELILMLLIFVMFLISSISASTQPTQQFNKIFLSPFYISSSVKDTNIPFTLIINPPDKIKNVISATINFDIWINPSVNFTLLVNGQSCNNPSYYISTTYASAGKTTISFDCSNVISQSNTYSIVLKGTKDTGALTGWLDLTYINNPLGEMQVFGTEYQVGDTGLAFVQLLDSNKKAINNASCFISSYYPNKTIWWNNNVMTYLSGSDGLYYKDFTSPNAIGIYMLSSTCYIPSTSFTDEFNDFSKLQDYKNVTIVSHYITLAIPINTTATKNPSNYSDDYSSWVNPQYAIGSDDLRSTTSTTGNMQDWYNFNFSIPSGVIKGITISLEGSTSSATTGVYVELSWNGGSSYTNTSYGYTTTSTTDAIRIFGNDTDLWGHNWTSDELNNTNFRLRLTKTGTAGVNHRIDNILVNVTYLETPLKRGYVQSININQTGYLWKNFSAIYTLNDGNITFEVRNKNNVTLCTGLGDISVCANSTSPINLYALLTINETLPSSTPTLDSWILSWLINRTIQEVQGSGELHITNYVSGLNTSINNIQTNNSAIAQAVWDYTNRNLTYYADVTNYTNVGWNVWNWAGGISSSILGFFSNDIWNYATRTLTFTEDVTNYSKIAEYVWIFSERNLTFYQINDIAPEDIWNYASRNLTFYGEAVNYSKTAEYVWFYVDRNLTTYPTNNITTADIWGYYNRSLTQDIPLQIWSYPDRNLTTDIPFDVWSYYNRTLTYYTLNLTELIEMVNEYEFTDTPILIPDMNGNQLTSYTLNVTLIVPV